MYEDIKELIDLAALTPNMTHREELWEKFQIAAQPTTQAVSVPRPALYPVNHSDTLTLQKVESIDEVVRRRNRRRVSSVFLLAAAIVTVAGIVAVNRNNNTVQVSPAASTSTQPNRTETTTAPTAASTAAAPTTLASAQSAAALPPQTTMTTASSTSVGATVPSAPNSTARVASPKVATSTGTPTTRQITVLDFVSSNELRYEVVPIGEWDGSTFVDDPKKVTPGSYQSLDGRKFDIETARDVDGGEYLRPTTRDVSGISFSTPSWPLQPRPSRSQGDTEVLKEARFDVYREEARKLAEELGGRNDLPELTSVVRVDLNGDGTDEVLVTALSVDLSNGHFSPWYPKVGSYSIAYVRHVVGNKAVSKVMSAEVATEKTTSLLPFGISTAVDVNGDGLMEVFGQTSGWENWGSTYCWDAGSADRDPRLLFGG